MATKPPAAGGTPQRPQSAVRLTPISPPPIPTSSHKKKKSSIALSVDVLTPTAATPAPEVVRPETPPSPPASTFQSLNAPSSLDEYIHMQNQQSSRGLEVVYGLKVELSKLLEELTDRDPEGRWGPKLPYRVLGVGGVLYWKNVREKALKDLHAPKPPHSTGEHEHEHEHEHHTRPARDPFSTHLPSVEYPPPPITPETVLPAYVLLNMLRSEVRTALTFHEDEAEELKQTIEMQQETETKLRNQIEELQQALEASKAFNQNMRLVRKNSTITAKQVHYADEYVVTGPTLAARQSPTPASPELDANSSGGRRSADASPRPSSRSGVRSPSGRTRSPVKSPSHGPALSNAAEALVHRHATNRVDSRMYNQAHAAESERNSARGVGGINFLLDAGNVNTAREEQLERSLYQLESALQVSKGVAEKLRIRNAEDEARHTKALMAMDSELKRERELVKKLEVELTQKNVQLSLENIARRQRDETQRKMEDQFARDMKAWEKEIQQLFLPANEMLFVKKADQSLPGMGSTLPPAVEATPTVNTVVTTVEPKSSRNAQQLTGRAKSAKKKDASAKKDLLSPSPSLSHSNSDSREMKENQQQLVPVGQELYPSPASPLTQLEKSSARTPAGAKWLGKLLNSVTPTSSPTPTTASPVPASSNTNSASASIQGHLVPGSELLACDMLLLLDDLFHREYQLLAENSVELCRSAQFAKDLAERKLLIANSPERLDMEIPLPPLTSKVPSTVELSTLLSSIPASSLHYLQAMQKLFLSLYYRVPPSIQHRYAELSKRMRRVTDLQSAAHQYRSLAEMKAASEQHQSSSDNAVPEVLALQLQSKESESPEATAAIGATETVQITVMDENEFVAAAQSAPIPSSLSAPASNTAASTTEEEKTALAVSVDGSKSGADSVSRPPPTPQPTFLSRVFATPHSSPISPAPSNASLHVDTASPPTTQEHVSPEIFTPTALISSMSSPGIAAPSPPPSIHSDRSLYLARLELLLHKVQAVASFRGVALQ